MYAIIGKGRYASQSDPGYIYEIEINADPKDAKYTRLVDPVKEIAGSLLDPPTGKYQHDDFPGILLGIVAPRLTVPFLRAGIIRPPSMAARPLPQFSLELRSLVQALRDAELLAVDYVPKACVTARAPVW